MPRVLAFPANTTPSDAEARAAALDTRASYIVEAPAGSGKTGLLVQRFLKLLGDPELAQPEEVLAMTFTRRATAEMQARVLEQLQSAASDTPLKDPTSAFERDTRTFALAALDRSRQLGWDLLAQPRRLNIRGIDAVCVDLANALPLLSGSGGQQQPVDFPGPLYQHAARQTLLQLGGPDPQLSTALTTVLLHRDGSLADCQRLIADMLHTREQWGELIPLHGPLDDTFLDQTIRPRLEQTLEAIVCAGLQRATDALPPGLLADLSAFAASHAHLPGYKDAPSPLTICAGKHLPPEAAAHHLDHWRALIRLLLKPSDGIWRAGFARNHIGFEIPKNSAAYLKDLITTIQTDHLQSALAAVLTLPSPVYPDEQWAVARALFHVLRHALIELKLLFAASSTCDFTEFSLNARAALAGDDAGLTLPAGGRLRHLLIDEMQDTSSSQYALIEALTQSWDGHSQTLFLVGDPKQSIYLFRQARVERFLRTVREQRLGDLRLTPLRLTANFRSQAALVHDFNQTFGGPNPIFPPPSQTTADGVPFVAATPTRPETQPLGLKWHPAVFAPDDPTASTHAELEAAEIRRIIGQRLATPLPPGRTKPWRIAVLARARGHLDATVKALKTEPEIPFRGIHLEPLAERPEVLDLLALTRALLHPADRIAWLAVLHAPWCGLGRADLLALTESGPPDSPIPTLLAATEPGIQSGFEGYGLQPVHSRSPETGGFSPGRNESRGHEPLDQSPNTTHLSSEAQQLLARAWPTLEAALATLGRTTLALHIERTWLSLGGDAWLTPDQRTNSQRFLTVLREIESDSSRIELDPLNARLKDLYAEPRTGDLQIDLTTIHNAKGLEWDVVLVPGLHRPPRASASTLLNWLELDALGPQEEPAILLAPIWGKGKDSDRLNDWLKSVRNQRHRAEEKRLFYVAATRAREELHLFAALTLTSKGELPAPKSGTLLQACWPAAESHFTDLLAPSTHLSSRPESAHLADVAERPAAQSGDTVLKGAGFSPYILIPQQEGASAPERIYPELALAASADPQPPNLQRLPLDFHPRARFRIHSTHRLRYTPAEALPQSPAFTRPEGGFAARAFGNVVHRYLELLAARLAAGLSPDTLLAELPAWPARLEASLRNEGLPPALAKRDAAQALRALQNTLTDSIGRWLLAPHPGAASERDLHLPTGATLRIDRTLRAAQTPLAPGDTSLWIVDFKTTEQGSRSTEAFRSAELAKYSPQLEAYAAQLRSLEPTTPIHLGLYYPLIPTLIHWPSPADAALPQ